MQFAYESKRLKRPRRPGGVPVQLLSSLSGIRRFKGSPNGLGVPVASRSSCSRRDHNKNARFRGRGHFCPFSRVGSCIKSSRRKKHVMGKRGMLSLLSLSYFTYTTLLPKLRSIPRFCATTPVSISCGRKFLNFWRQGSIGASPLLLPLFSNCPASKSADMIVSAPIPADSQCVDDLRSMSS